MTAELLAQIKDICAPLPPSQRKILVRGALHTAQEALDTGDFAACRALLVEAYYQLMFIDGEKQ
jgi:hypothetical protein